MRFRVRRYNPEDETGWVRCRVLSFLDSPYFDNVLTAKERYEHPSVELVAELDGTIVGLLDAEYEREPDTVAFDVPGVRSNRGSSRLLGAVIHHLAVHPDYRAQGIATELLQAAFSELRAEKISFVEAWTRDKGYAYDWYKTRGFESVFHYLHVYMNGHDEHNGVITSATPVLRPVFTFAHYVGSDFDRVKQQFERVYECHLFRRSI